MTQRLALPTKQQAGCSGVWGSGVWCRGVWCSWVWGVEGWDVGCRGVGCEDLEVMKVMWILK